MRILILHNTPEIGRPDDADTVEQANQIDRAVKALGYSSNIACADNLAQIEKLTKQHKPQLVFNVVEAFFGLDKYIHLVPCYLESIGIAYTGCTGESMLLTGNKITAKKIMNGLGIPTPDYIDGCHQYKSNPPYIVKSATQHASFGLDTTSVVNDKTSAQNLISAKTLQHGGVWFAENYIDGREFNISVMGTKNDPQILPLAEIIFQNFAPDRPKIVDYESKWHAESQGYNNTVRSFVDNTSEIASKIKEIVLGCWYGFELSGYARIDFRVDNAGNPWVLEINTNPCLTDDAGFVAATAKGGMTYKQTINHIMEIALNDFKTKYSRCV